MRACGAREIYPSRILRVLCVEAVTFTDPPIPNHPSDCPSCGFFFIRVPAAGTLVQFLGDAG
ncbi:MAG TPA: hypothetical protein VGD08_14185, partial [Stellaceae bacterium]